MQAGGNRLSSYPVMGVSLTAGRGNKQILLRFAKLVRDLLPRLTLAAVTLIKQHQRNGLSCWVASSTPQSLPVLLLGRDAKSNLNVC